MTDTPQEAARIKAHWLCPSCGGKESYRPCSWEERHAAIDRAIRLATLAGKVEQAETDAYLANSDAGCCGVHNTSEYEKGRIAAFKDVITERDRLRADFEKEVKGE